MHEVEGQGRWALVERLPTRQDEVTLRETGTKEVTSELKTGRLARVQALQLTRTVRRIHRPRRWVMLNDGMLLIS